MAFLPSSDSDALRQEIVAVAAKVGHEHGLRGRPSLLESPTKQGPPLARSWNDGGTSGV